MLLSVGMKLNVTDAPFTVFIVSSHWQRSSRLKAPTHQSPCSFIHQSAKGRGAKRCEAEEAILLKHRFTTGASWQ